MLSFARAVTACNAFLFAAAKWLIYVIAALMIFEIISRYSLSSPTSWAPELAALIFGPFFLLGGPYLLHKGGHVSVDLLSGKARGRLKKALAIVGLLLAMFFGAVLLWFALPLVLQSFEYGETSYSSWNPVLWPSKAFLPLSALLLVLQAFAEIIFRIYEREER